MRERGGEGERERGGGGGRQGEREAGREGEREREGPSWTLAACFSIFCARSAWILLENNFNSKVSGNEVYYTA